MSELSEFAARLPILRHYRKWCHYEDVMRRLQAFDELSLNELGINKSDFEAIARGTFRGWDRTASEVPSQSHAS